jgi:hypothetical protein
MRHLLHECESDSSREWIDEHWKNMRRCLEWTILSHWPVSSVNNLALVLQGQRKYEDAEKMNWQALEGREKVLGVDHPDTLTSIYCLVIVQTSEISEGERMTKKREWTFKNKHIIKKFMLWEKFYCELVSELYKICSALQKTAMFLRALRTHFEPRCPHNNEALWPPHFESQITVSTSFTLGLLLTLTELYTGFPLHQFHYAASSTMQPVLQEQEKKPTENYVRLYAILDSALATPFHVFKASMLHRSNPHTFIPSKISDSYEPGLLIQLI